MRCPTCDAILPEYVNYCYGCGTSLPPAPSAEMYGRQQIDPTVASGPPPAPQWGASEQPMTIPAQPLGGQEPPWAEFSGEQSQTALPASGYSYGPSANYPYTSGYPSPYAVPPLMTPPRGSRPVFAIAMTVGSLILLVILGSVFIGIHIGQAHTNVNTTQPIAGATVAATSTADANQLYQQVTSKPPTYTDALTDATLSKWAVFEKPTYGCEVKSDGLHVHVKDNDEFIYCTSGHGQFSAFAFQASMKMSSGDGGGMTLRGDTTAGNFYYFHVYPDGTYHIYINQDDKLGKELGDGTIDSFASGDGQENTLTVIAMGTEMNFYANQKLITTVQDATFTSGYLGLLSVDSAAPAEVVYTNARIWSL